MQPVTMTAQQLLRASRIAPAWISEQLLSDAGAMLGRALEEGQHNARGRVIMALSVFSHAGKRDAPWRNWIVAGLGVRPSLRPERLHR